MQLLPSGIKRSDFYSIPNILGYFRIALIPVFMTFIVTADGKSDYYWAAAVVMISTITDFLDGFIARTFHQVTALGVLLDPVADKMTHMALAIGLVFRYPLMGVVIGVMVVKEGFMFVMGLVKLQSGKQLGGAKWFGKVRTAAVYLIMFTLLLWVEMPLNVANGLITLAIVLLGATMAMYIPVFAKM